MHKGLRLLLALLALSLLGTFAPSPAPVAAATPRLVIFEGFYSIT